MKKTHLNKKHKDAIKKWLAEEEDSDIKEFCPFRWIVYDCPGKYYICAELFPKIMDNKYSGVCPCQVYPLNTVIRVAKKAIREAEKEEK